MKANYRLITGVAGAIAVATIAGAAIVNALIIGQWHPAMFSKVTTGDFFSCGLADGKVYCWGRNDANQLGNGTTTNALIPTPVTTSGALSGKTMKDIDAGGASVCATDTANALYCWGGNTYGQIGNGVTGGTSSTPTLIASITNVTSISVGYAHACAIANNTAYCWGWNDEGQLGDGSRTDRNAPRAVTAANFTGKTLSTIDAGGGLETTTSNTYLSHSCAVANNAVYCWGNNKYGQLGDNSTKRRTSPRAVQGGVVGKVVTGLSTGNQHTCATAVNQLYCWGNNSVGQLGDNTTTNRRTAVLISGGSLAGKLVALVNAGVDDTCVVDSLGGGHCMGEIAVGNGTLQQWLVPTAMVLPTRVSGQPITSLSSARDHICMTVSNLAYCWVGNGYGQIGNNTTSGTFTNTPQAVLSFDGGKEDAYRVYNNANSLTPGAPLAASSQPATLRHAQQPFRVRVGIRSANTSGTPIDMLSGGNSFKLQFAQKTSASCSIQTGYADVTATSVIAWNTNTGAANDASISSDASDPTLSGVAAYQTYRSAAGNFSNPHLIPSGNVGLWDFSLKDNVAPASTTYCLRVSMANGTALDAYTTYPEITTSQGQLGASFVDASGNQLATTPIAAMNPATSSTSCLSTTGIIGMPTERMRVNNQLATRGWSLSIAANGGGTDKWVDSINGSTYDYNDPSGSPAGCNSGSDGDGLIGQLTLSPQLMTITPVVGCSNIGVSKGTATAFSQSVVDAISLANASSSTGELGCAWDFTGLNLTQTIPANQPAGDYQLNLTITVTAQ